MNVVIVAALSGIASAVWAYGLWYAAPLIARATDARVERVAAFLALGIALPFAFASLGLATGPLLWLALAALVAARVARYGVADTIAAPQRDRTIAVAIALGVFVALAAPPLVRPLMDGDTLEYHLPLVASFAAHHGIWTAGTRYWWYPFGSELFALGPYLAAGIDNVGLAGVVPAALLVARIVARRSDGSHVPATLVACGLLATSVAARELVSLQNDVWLAALYVECVFAFDVASAASLALVKPSGFAFAAAAAVVGRIAPARVLLAAVPFALWIVRDATLSSRAALHPTFGGQTWRTSLAFHLPQVLRGVPHALVATGPAWSLVVAMALVGFAVATDARARIGGALAFLAYVFAPFGFENGTPQFADGHSFRFALPAVAVGIALFATSPRIDARLKGTLGAVACALGVVETWLLYANDAKTFATPALAIIAVVAYVPSRRGRAWRAAFACVCLSGAAYCAVLAGSSPADYVDDRYGVGGRPTHAFAWLALHPTARIVADHVPAGAILVVRPEADVGNVRDDAPCADARARDAWLVVATAHLPEGCGRRLYADDALTVVAPSH